MAQRRRRVCVSKQLDVDATERAALTALAQPLVPAVLGAIAPIFPIPGPILWTAISAAAAAAAQYPALGPLPTYGLCGGMDYAALDHWKAGVPIARGANAADPARTPVPPLAIRNSIWQRLLAGIPVGQPLPVEPVRSWSWLNMGRPQGANIRGLLGAVTVMDTPTSPQRPHVFIEGNDANLWCYCSG
jgi:hypothetical protein